jgi:hypothetical protein
MAQLEARQLQKGDIETGTECQARDGNLNLRDWVVRCPECGSYTHKDCWVANGNKCPRQGCRGAGQVSMPAPVQAQTPRQQPARAPQIRQQQTYQLPSRYLSSLLATDSSTSLLAQKCGRDGGRFLVGDKIVRCPSCGTPYHEHCWQANGNRCSQLACGGSGLLWRLQASQLPSSNLANPLAASYRPPYSPVESESWFIKLIKFPFRLIGALLKLVFYLVVIAIILGVILEILSSTGII